MPDRNLDKIRDLASWLVVAVKEGHHLPHAVAAQLAAEEAGHQAQARREAQAAR